MRLIIKQKVVSVAGKYFIKDREDRDVYVVKGSYTFPKKYRVFDMQDREIVKIKKKFFRIFFATFDFFVNGSRVCRAKRKFSIKPKYEIKGATGEYTISGNFFEWDYSIKKGEQVVASVFKKLTLYRDSYILDIEEGFEKELPVILGITIMFDHVHHRSHLFS